MRRLALIIAVVCISVGANAQGMFEYGTQIFKLGIGVNGDGTPFEVSYERGVQENFLGVDGLILGLGGNLGYYGYKKDFSGYSMNYSWKYNNIIAAGRALVHYGFISNLDTYGGLMLGYNVADTKYEGPNSGSIPSPSAGGLILGGLVGARYAFSPAWGAYIEAGFGISNLNIGVAYKF
jgi:hypothetical protein